MTHDERLNLFKELWDQKGHNTFGGVLKEQYIDELRGDDAGRKVILKGDTGKSSEEFREKSKQFDPDLMRFSKYMDRYFTYNQKACRWIPLPSLSPDDVSRIKAFASRSFAPALGSDWALAGVRNTTTGSTFSYSRKGHKVVNTTLSKDELKSEPGIDPEDVWKVLMESSAVKVHAEVNGLPKVSLALTVPGVSVAEISFDWSNKVLSISTDAKDFDEETSKSTVELNLQRRAEVVQKLIDDVGVATSAPTLQTVNSAEGIGKEVLRELRVINDSDTLVVVRVGEFRLEHQLKQIVEDVKSTLATTTEALTVKAAEGYYRDHGTFNGFFEVNASLSPQNAFVQGQLLSKPDAASQGLKGFFLYVTDDPDDPGKQEAKGKLYQKRVDVLSFDYREESDEWVIRNKYYSKAVYDAFLRKVLEISRRPARPQPPTKRSAP